MNLLFFYDRLRHIISKLSIKKQFKCFHYLVVLRRPKKMHLATQRRRPMCLCRRPTSRCWRNQPFRTAIPPWNRKKINKLLIQCNVKKNIMNFIFTSSFVKRSCFPDFCSQSSSFAFKMAKDSCISANFKFRISCWCYSRANWMAF